MSMTSPDPVISGVPYVVVEVDGRAPDSVDALAGAAGIVVEGTTGRHVVLGQGARSDDGVRFHEKGGSGGKDVRVWNIHREPDGTIVAVTD